MRSGKLLFWCLLGIKNKLSNIDVKGIYEKNQGFTEVEINNAEKLKTEGVLILNFNDIKEVKFDYDSEELLKLDLVQNLILDPKIITYA